MKKNHSPWLLQLKQDRVHHVLVDDENCDVAIIGAGIAGISTAFFVLKYTNKSVVLLERYKLAHGATGHNAGQVVSYFERGFASIVGEFGLPLAAAGQKDVEDAWMLLDEMYTDSLMDIPFDRFLGHAGLSSKDQLMLHLENNALRRQAGLNTEAILVSNDVPFLGEIPKNFADLFVLVPHETIKKTLETQSDDFLAVISYQKGVVNSALFCEEAIKYLQEKFADRFDFYEHADVEKVVLGKDSAVLDAHTHIINAKHVVLCTNGFENIKIFNHGELDIDKKYHEIVSSIIGYMSGYLEDVGKLPTGISYFTQDTTDAQDPYFYITRRNYEFEEGKKHNLISIGGPETKLSEGGAYSYEHEFPDEKAEEIDAFVKKYYAGSKKIDYVFTWHGLMGYTKNGIRLIGFEPNNKTLLYNLGCNGIGILPSVYGGKRIADLLSKGTLPPSIFDVPKHIE